MLTRQVERIAGRTPKNKHTLPTQDIKTQTKTQHTRSLYLAILKASFKAPPSTPASNWLEVLI